MGKKVTPHGGHDCFEWRTHLFPKLRIPLIFESGVYPAPGKFQILFSGMTFRDVLHVSHVKLDSFPPRFWVLNQGPTGLRGQL